MGLGRINFPTYNTLVSTMTLKSVFHTQVIKYFPANARIARCSKMEALAYINRIIHRLSNMMNIYVTSVVELSPYDAFTCVVSFNSTLSGRKYRIVYDYVPSKSELQVREVIIASGDDADLVL